MKKVLKAIYRFYLFTTLKILALFNRLGWTSFYQPIPQVGINIAKNKENTQRVLNRWKAIESALPENGAMSVLDLGCSVGYYSINMAQKGHFVTAVEARRFDSKLTNLAKEYLGLNNLALSNLFITPENVNTLPEGDCTFLLAVFHHWCEHYGSEKALAMLDTVYKKSHKVLFFETGQPSSRYREFLPDMGDSVENWLHELFKSKGCSSVKTISHPESSRYLIAVYKN